MAEDYIQLPIDSIGKKVRSFSNVVGANTVHSQGSTIVDTLGNAMANLDGSGRIQVASFGPLTDTQLRATAVPVSGPLTDTQLRATAVPVSGTITANAGTNLNTSALATQASLVAMSLVDNAAFTDGTTRVTPAGYVFDDVAGTALTENDIAAARIDSKRAVVFTMEDATTRGQKAAVTAEGRVAIVPARPATPTQTSVALSTTNATILAAAATRHGATVYNDSTSNLYLKLGATASNTSFTILMAPQSYYEVPFGYTGIIDGVLNTGTGNARVTQLTA